MSLLLLLIPCSIDSLLIHVDEVCVELIAFDQVYNLLEGQPSGVLQEEAFSQDGLNQIVMQPGIAEAAQTRVSVELQVKDVVLRFLRCLTVKWIFLVDHVVDAAAKAPNINFIGEVGLFEDKLWS